MSKVWRSDGTPHREEGLKRWGQFWGCTEFPPCRGTQALGDDSEPEEPDQPSRRPGLLPVEWTEGARRADFVPEHVSVGTMPGIPGHPDSRVAVHHLSRGPGLGPAARGPLRRLEPAADPNRPRELAGAHDRWDRHAPPEGPPDQAGANLSVWRLTAREPGRPGRQPPLWRCAPGSCQLLTGCSWARATSSCSSASYWW